MVETDNKFSYIDYIVFFIMLFISAAIGFFYAWKDKHNKSVDQVLLGGRKLKIFPVAMSIMASFTSAVSVLGFSVEMYRFGSMYLMIGLSYFLTQPFAAQVYVPFFHRLKITSAYEYLEMRFNYLARISASIVFCIEMFLYMAVVLYSPSLAVQQVTGFPLWISVFLTGLVCTIYTSLGGMKAVVFTDTFQVFVMFTGLFAIIIEGSIRVGGIDVVFQRMEEGDRFEWFDFNPSPFERHTFWSLMVGGFFTSLTVYGSNQATIQRYLTLSTIREAKISMYLNLLGTVSILIVCCLCGFVAFAFYYGCDPFLSGKVNRPDQILPYLVMDLLKNYYGLPGLFISCVYSAALSTISSGLNSLTAVCLHDFVYPLHKKYKKKEISEKTSMLLSKILAALFGAITIGLSFLCEYVGTTVLQISLSIFGILGGPLLGLISLGMFVPFANSYGALTGFYISIAVNIWLSLCSILYGKKPKPKIFTQDSCDVLFNSTQMFANATHQSYAFTTSTANYLTSNNSSLAAQSSSFEFRRIYDISYYWFSLIAIIIIFFFGIIVSLLTKNKEKKELDEKLFYNFSQDFFICHKSITRRFRKITNKDTNDKKSQVNLLNKIGDDITNEMI